ncbi:MULTISPECIES: hypothetical protein [unclassified Curtobacterium]|uniref:hypothetical protein n=1 Tax=unclassified Curtobacterium TaxID=257496 RepID=UPI0009175BD6|nr:MULTISPECIES: hypothetical protein [unclassified Curtobacterium]WIA97236.1 hypothetical protein QOL16_02250 [Curtobacterium sp. MCBA15_004]WIB00553.1 hypothetical protein QOL15_02345 [Curtobacterium sp. MCBA15_012]
MDTEPPQGDDLQRMLVSMKRNVLDGAAPRPRRRRGRPGIVVGVVALLALGTATGAVALTLSQQDRPVAAPVRTEDPAPAPSATTPTSAPVTDRPSPRPSRTAASTTATIPTDCRSVVPASDYDRFFGDVPLATIVADGKVSALPHRDPVGAPPTLSCQWRDPGADITGLELTMGTGTPEQIAELERGTFDGWSPTCEDDADGARVCRASRTDPTYGTDWARTTYVRGDTWLAVDQSNFPTNGLLPAVVGEVWGD